MFSATHSPWFRIGYPALALVLLSGGRSVAQCVAPISTFPYQEGFETVPAWTSGGNASDWAWGTPAHPVINTAGGGSKSWCVGGLTGTFYTLGQLSWLESPCFDMTAMDHPWISFKIFWECERQYDGMLLQVSINGGTSWSNVGAWGDPVDCLNDNWFNSGNITNLTGASPKHGWSGRIGATVGSCQGGFGSLQWVEAKHCVPNASNESQVKFRFLFGAGTTCNSYDGIAIDDILIQNAPPTLADLSFSCTGNTVNFQELATSCPSGFAWNFGDPGSGAMNTSTQPDPAHTYPGPGTYTVTLTVTGPCSDPSTMTVPVTVLGVSTTVTDPACAGGLGAAEAIVTGGNGPFTFDWQPAGGTSATASGLSPGAYTVSVGGTGVCGSTASATITAPPPVTVVPMADTTVCADAPLTLQAVANGGTGALSVVWSPSGPLLSPAVAGTYTAVATDANGCTSMPATVDVQLHPAVSPFFSVSDPVGCATHCTQLTDLTANAVQVSWSLGDGSSASASTFQHCYSVPGMYSIVLTATDANGCSGTYTGVDVVEVLAAPSAGFTASPEIASVADPSFLFLDASVDADSWTWTFGDGSAPLTSVPSPTHVYDGIGCYIVSQVVSSSFGCTDSAAVQVCVEDEYNLYVPNAFSPNADGINDAFYVQTSVLSPRQYELSIFDRWGAEIWTTADRYEAWKGENVAQGIYTWRVSFLDSQGTQRTKVGHVMLLR